MKKYFILFAFVAMMAMTACNEKPAKSEAGKENAPAVTEQTTTPGETKEKPVVDVERAKPTADGKDHTVAEFNTPDYQVRLENLADGNYRISLWKIGQDKSGKPEQVGQTKQCVMSNGTYLMKTDDGTVYLVNAQKGAEQLTIMNGEKIIYPKN